MQPNSSFAGSINAISSTHRRQLVCDLIISNTIRSQAELLEKLEDEGHYTTQATLSRDLKVLKIGKLRDSQGRYVYAFSNGDPLTQNTANLSEIFLQGYQSLTFSGQLAVIHTLPGHGQSVAFALDELKVRGIIGTVAGDDTVLAVIANGVTASKVWGSLKKLVPYVDRGSI